MQRTAGWCECGIPEFTEWTCEGGSKPKKGRRRREFVRYQWGAHDGA